MQLFNVFTRKALASLSILALVALFGNSSFSQGFIAASTFIGGNGSEQQSQFVVDNGETYIVGQTFRSSGVNTFPVTKGGPANSPWELTVTKLDANGNMVWSRFLGGNNSEYCSRLAVSNGSLFIVGNTPSADFPVTDGSTHSGAGVVNGFLTRLDANTGDIQFSTLFGQGSAYGLDITDGYVYVVGDLYSTAGSDYDLLLVKYNIANMALVYRKTFGGNLNDSYQNGYSGKNFQVVGNNIYIAFFSNSVDFPVTNGSELKGTTGIIYAKINAVDGDMQFATYWGGDGFSEVLDLRVDNNGVFIFGNTLASNLAITVGNGFEGLQDLFLVKFNATTNAVVFSRYIGGNDMDYAVNMEVQNNIVYLLANSNSFTNFPITAGITFGQGGGDMAVMKLDPATGDVNYASFISGSSSLEDGTKMNVVNGEMYITGVTYSNNYPVTNGSVYLGPGNDETILTKIGVNNAICFSTYLGHSSGDYPVGLTVSGDFVYVSGITTSASFPVTTNTTRSFGTEYFWTKFNLNPTLIPGPDVVSPATQTVCRNGVATLLTAPPIVFPSSNMPLIYRAGVASTQNAIDFRYQWQVAASPTGPWTNIPGAVEVNFAPQAGTTDQYFRRNTFASICASTNIISTSTVASVLVSANTAPVVDAGTVLNTCANTSVVLGGAPTAVAQGGASISSYLWTPSTAVFTPSSSSTNPTVSPATTSIYTVQVTDNNGCVQIGQVLVNAYAANAGPDASSCSGQPVRIGSTPIAGLPGVTYAWTSVSGDPVTLLSCTNCAQPDVNNLTQQSTYRLTLTIPISGGGTCSSTDDVIVRPVAGPTTSFGAPDVTVCTGGSISIGRPAEAGFNYTWSPGSYLTFNSTTPVTFQPGTYGGISPNPYAYYLTASRNGCIYVDTVMAYILKADAGMDVCGPVMIGTANTNPGISPTYNWTKITAGAGTSNFLGSSNQERVAVSACTVPTVFRLDVTLNGVTCSDLVTVNACACSVPAIQVSSPNGCKSYLLGNNDVTLTASTFLPSTFTWSTTGGVTLSAYSGASVKLTNNLPGIVTVTATNIVDGSSFCDNSVEVNNPAWSVPIFRALDTAVCPSTAVNIGQPTVAGYTYVWESLSASLSPDNGVANPIALVNSTTDFRVLVTDVGSGCFFRDTATITIMDFPPDIGGPSVNFCGVSTSVQLGVPALPNVTYMWTPATTYIPANTAANPTVTVAATTTFYITATNSITGCVKQDSVRVIVNPAVPAFSFPDQFFCPSAAGAMALPAGPAAMAAYQWLPASIVVNPTSNGPTATSLVTKPQTTTTYTLRVTNANGCSASAPVRFIPNTPLADAGPNRVICRNSSTQLGSAAAPGYSYVWTGAAIARLNATNISNPVFTPTNIGTFTFTVTKSTGGGCSITAQVVINVVDFNLPLITSPTVCENTCIQIGTINQSGVQYTWTPQDGLSNASIANPIACVTTNSKAYTLTAVGVNGCVSRRDVLIGVNPTLSPGVTIPVINTCLGGSINTFQPVVTPSGTYNFLWSPNNGTLDNIYSPAPVVTPTKVGTTYYNLNVADAITGCATNAIGEVNTFYCNVLEVPIQLKATLAGTLVTLQWKAPQQNNIIHYELEHSTDGIKFTRISWIEVVAGNQYDRVHYTPAQGVNYYRVRYADRQGQFGYSRIQQVNYVVEQSFTLYPNPAGQYCNLSISNQLVNKPADIILISGDGRMVWRKKINNLNKNEHIELGNIKPGKYYIRLVSKTGVHIKELIVIR